MRAKKHGTKSGTGAPLRRRFSCVAGPNRLKVTAAQLVLRGFSDAEMGIDLRDRRLGVSHRRPACPVLAPWARELIRPLGKRTVAAGLNAGLSRPTACAAPGSGAAISSGGPLGYNDFSVINAPFPDFQCLGSHGDSHFCLILRIRSIRHIYRFTDRGISPACADHVTLPLFTLRGWLRLRRCPAGETV